MKKSFRGGKLVVGGFVLLTMLLTATTTGVASAASHVAADPNAVLKIQATAGPNLDPIDNTYTCEAQNLKVIYDGLFIETSDGTFQPSLATSYKLLPNNILQLSLRKGVKFQDGTPFNASAVQFNLNRAISDPATTIKTTLTGLVDVTIVNPTTVDLVMDGPDAGPILVALADRAGMMVSPTAVQKAGTEANFAVHPVGAGPYKFVAMSARQSLTVRKWKGYWNPSAQTLGGIDFTEVPFTSLVNAIRAGDEQWVSPQTVADANTLKSDSKLNVKVSPGNIFNLLVLNPSIAPFNNLKVRQALSYAIDRQAVANTLEPGAAKATYQEFQPGTPAYDAKLDSKPYYPYNPTKAKQLLAQAGMPNGFTFTAIVGSSATQYVQQGEIIASQLAKVGITMNVKLVDISTAFTQVYGQGGSVQAASYGGQATVDPLAAFQASFTPGGVTNAGKYATPGVAALVNKAASTLNGAQRAKLFQQANDLVTKDVSNGVPLFFVPNINAIDTSVGGVTAAQNYCNTSFRGVYLTKGLVPAKKS